MNTLIDRLEKAGGPDRALDCAIAAEFGALDNFDPTNFIVPVTYRVSDNERMVEAWTQVPGQEPWRQASRTPRSYTASIDAALTLVPEGCVWALNFASMATVLKCGPSGGVIDGIEVGSWPENQDEAERKVTPAIALCIAALKARALATSR